MKKLYLLIVLAVVPLLTMCAGPYGHMMDGWDRSCVHGYGGMFMGILFLVLLGVVIFFIVHNVRFKKGTGQTQETPIDILKKRYAKGEITKEDYDRIKSDLQ